LKDISKKPGFNKRKIEADVKGNKRSRSNSAKDDLENFNHDNLIVGDFEKIEENNNTNTSQALNQNSENFAGLTERNNDPNHDDENKEANVPMVDEGFNMNFINQNFLDASQDDLDDRCNEIRDDNRHNNFEIVSPDDLFEDNQNILKRYTCDLEYDL